MRLSEAKANLETAEKAVEEAKKVLAKAEKEEQQKKENLRYMLITKPQLILGLILFVAFVLAWIGR